MKRRLDLPTLLAVAALLTWSSAGLTQGEGRLYVLESSVITIAEGRQYASTDTITIPAGGTIRAIMPSGKTRTIKGPYSGPVAGLAKDQSVNDRVLAWIQSFLQTGGANERLPGATRGVRSDHEKFSWTAIPVTVDSVICVTKGAQLQLVRDPYQHAERMTIVDVEMSRRGDVRWSERAAVADWPTDMEVRANATYTLLIPDQPQRRATLRVLDNIPGDDDIPSELATRDCKHQFDAWIRAQTGRKTL